MAKNKTAITKRSVRNREDVARLQTKNHKKQGQAKQGHQYIVIQKVATEEPNEVSLGL